MDYIKIRFGDDLDEFDCDLEKTVQGMFRSMSPGFRLTRRSWRPQMDIYETPEEIVILAEVAGVRREDLDVEINNRAIKLSGHRHPPGPRVDNATYRLAEIQYGRFERMLLLPAPVDPEKVTAVADNGFLTVRLPKKPLERDRVCKVPISQG
jgi:HSP20 family protein